MADDDFTQPVPGFGTFNRLIRRVLQMGIDPDTLLATVAQDVKTFYGLGAEWQLSALTVKKIRQDGTGSWVVWYRVTGVMIPPVLTFSYFTNSNPAQAVNPNDEVVLQGMTDGVLNLVVDVADSPAQITAIDTDDEVALAPDNAPPINVPAGNSQTLTFTPTAVDGVYSVQVQLTISEVDYVFTFNFTIEHVDPELERIFDPEREFVADGFAEIIIDPEREFIDAGLELIF